LCACATEFEIGTINAAGFTEDDVSVGEKSAFRTCEIVLMIAVGAK
jgi:hypothetical protein